ncbi:MAG: hypothetical protein WCS96_06320 [Victivallales bacterium]
MDILTYPFDCYGEIPRPLILVKIDSFSNPYPALVDTGADFTILPKAFLEELGHSNKSQNVLSAKAGGFGGKAHCFIHTLGISLLDENLTPVWNTGKIKVGFAGINSGIDSIVLGRDIICSKWRRLIINSEGNNPKDWSVKIFI